MTEFEQQVAETLAQVLGRSTAEILEWEPPPGYDGPHHGWPAYLANELAPRVAAAILAAGQTARDRADAFSPGIAALAALRGES